MDKLPYFSGLRQCVTQHIPHHYSKAMKLDRGGSRGGAWGAHAPPFGTEPARNAGVCYALSARSYFDAVHISV